MLSLSDYAKPKFTMKKKEMLKFNDLCEEAARQCPQFRSSLFEDREILLGSVNGKELVSVWISCDTLFGKGYEAYLPEEAQEVFKLYRAYKAEKKVWNTLVNGHKEG